MNRDEVEQLLTAIPVKGMPIWLVAPKNGVLAPRGRENSNEVIFTKHIRINHSGQPGFRVVPNDSENEELAVLGGWSTSKDCLASNESDIDAVRRFLDWVYNPMRQRDEQQQVFDFVESSVPIAA